VRPISPIRAALLAAHADRYDMPLVDRLTRRIRDLAYLMKELEKINVHFRSATEPFDTSSAAGRMLVQMLGVFAVISSSPVDHGCDVGGRVKDGVFDLAA
jgi:hypothetical protein